MIPTQKGAISSSQQRKLPRHYNPRETFLFELTHP